MGKLTITNDSGVIITNINEKIDVSENIEFEGNIKDYKISPRIMNTDMSFDKLSFYELTDNNIKFQLTFKEGLMIISRFVYSHDGIDEVTLSINNIGFSYSELFHDEYFSTIRIANYSENGRHYAAAENLEKEYAEINGTMLLKEVLAHPVFRKAIMEHLIDNIELVDKLPNYVEIIGMVL